MTQFSLALGLLGFLAVGDKSASVRIINAVADREQLAFSVDSGVWERIPYGQRTRFEEIPVESKLTITSVMQRRGEKIANDVPVKLQPGYPHTIIFTGMITDTGNYAPIVLRDSTAGKPSAGSVQIQFVNAMSDQIPIAITMNDSFPQRKSKIEFGASTSIIGFDPREYEVKLLDAKKTVLYTTKLKLFGATRYTLIAMGAISGIGNRGPRVFVYTF